MRILFTTPILEHPAAGGPQLRIENSIKALSAVCDLDIIHRAHRRDAVDACTSEYFRHFAEEYVTIYARNGILSPWWMLRQCQRVAGRLLGSSVARHARFIVDHVDRRGIDVVWFGYGNISYSLIRKIKAIRPDLKVVCDTDSVWSRFVLRELPYAKGIRKVPIWWRGIRKTLEEKAWVNLCEVTTAVSDVDAQYYRGLARSPDRVHIFSNVIDVDDYGGLAEEPPDFRTPSMYLAGTFGHENSPMDMAARWVLNEVFPRVLKVYPSLHFYIVGRNSDSSFGHLNGSNITATGKLPSVLPYLKNSNVALVPLKFESGTRFKILEAGACKIPIVSTVLGAEGIPVRPGIDILIADSAVDFSNAIVKILSDRKFSDELASRCQRLIIDDYSVGALTRQAKRIIEYLGLSL